MKAPPQVWRPAAEPTRLARNEVHVWRAGLDVEETARKRLEETLAAGECDRAARFRFEKDQHQYAVARGILRDLLGRYLNEAPETVRFRYTAHGKPELDGPAGPDTVHFNVSHSHGVGLFAFAQGQPVGVDIEAIRDDVEWDKLAQRFFAPGEVACLHRLADVARRKAFFECWARKEAYLKARGGGLSLGLDRFEVTADPEAAAALVHVEDDPDEPARWLIAALAPGPDHVGAVAVRDPGLAVQRWDWNEASSHHAS